MNALGQIEETLHEIQMDAPQAQAKDQFNALIRQVGVLQRQVRLLAEENDIWIDQFNLAHPVPDLQSGHIQALINALLQRAYSILADRNACTHNGQLSTEPIEALFVDNPVEACRLWIHEQHPIVESLENELINRDQRFTYQANGHYVVIKIQK